MIQAATGRADGRESIGAGESRADGGEAGVAKAAFRLHPELDAGLYRVEGTCAQVRRWTAPAYHGTDEDDPPGHPESVGYVMISLEDDTIIPVSRSDEHHRGYDLLGDLARGDHPLAGGRAMDVRPDAYAPIWSYGTNYIYSRDEIPDMLEALRKWLSYGGTDGVLYGANDLGGTAIQSSLFVARNGDVAVAPGTLAPLGAAVFRSLREMSEGLADVEGDESRIAMAPIGRRAKALMADLKGFGYKTGVDRDLADRLAGDLRKALRTGRRQDLLEALFGFGGVKNSIHVKLREIAADPNHWYARDARAIWGDVGLAIDMLGRL